MKAELTDEWTAAHWVRLKVEMMAERWACSKAVMTAANLANWMAVLKVEC